MIWWYHEINCMWFDIIASREFASRSWWFISLYRPPSLNRIHFRYRSFVRRRQSESIGLTVTRDQRARFRASFHGDKNALSEDLDQLFQREWVQRDLKCVIQVLTCVIGGFVRIDGELRGVMWLFWSLFDQICVEASGLQGFCYSVQHWGIGW